MRPRDQHHVWMTCPECATPVEVEVILTATRSHSGGETLHFVVKATHRRVATQSACQVYVPFVAEACHNRLCSLPKGHPAKCNVECGHCNPERKGRDEMTDKDVPRPGERLEFGSGPRIEYSPESQPSTPAVLIEYLEKRVADVSKQLGDALLISGKLADKVKGAEGENAELVRENERLLARCRKLEEQAEDVEGENGLEQDLRRQIRRHQRTATTLNEKIQIQDKSIRNLVSVQRDLESRNNTLEKNLSKERKLGLEMCAANTEMHEVVGKLRSRESELLTWMQDNVPRAVAMNDGDAFGTAVHLLRLSKTAIEGIWPVVSQSVRHVTAMFDAAGVPMPWYRCGPDCANGHTYERFKCSLWVS